MKTKLFAIVLALVAVCMISCKKSDSGKLSSNEDIPTLLENAMTKSSMSEIQTYLEENDYVYVKEYQGAKIFGPKEHTEFADVYDGETNLQPGTVIGVEPNENAFVFESVVVTKEKAEYDNLHSLWSAWVAAQKGLELGKNYIYGGKQEGEFYILAYSRGIIYE